MFPALLLAPVLFAQPDTYQTTDVPPIPMPLATRAGVGRGVPPVAPPTVTASDVQRLRDPLTGLRSSLPSIAGPELARAVDETVRQTERLIRRYETLDAEGHTPVRPTPRGIVPAPRWD